MIFFYYLLIYACLVTESKGLKYNYVHVFFFSFFLAKLNVLFFRFLSQDLSYFLFSKSHLLCYPTTGCFCHQLCKLGCNYSTLSSLTTLNVLQFCALVIICCVECESSSEVICSNCCCSRNWFRGQYHKWWPWYSSWLELMRFVCYVHGCFSLCIIYHILIQTPC